VEAYLQEERREVARQGAALAEHGPYRRLAAAVGGDDCG
jgi:hypothetical protein